MFEGTIPDGADIGGVPSQRIGIDRCGTFSAAMTEGAVTYPLMVHREAGGPLRLSGPKRYGITGRTLWTI